MFEGQLDMLKTGRQEATGSAARQLCEVQNPRTHNPNKWTDFTRNPTRIPAGCIQFTSGTVGRPAPGGRSTRAHPHSITVQVREAEA